jgi:hypothetical protein
MYVRRTQTRSTATGETYFTHRLVRSERYGKKVRAVTVLNLGRHFPVPQDHWPALCARIEELVYGQGALLPVNCPLAVEQAAQRYAALLLARQGTMQEAPAGSAEGTVSADVQSVDVDSLELTRPRSVGVEHIALWAMQAVGFVELLVEFGVSGPVQAAILGSIIGRMAQPASERATRRWLEQRSGLGELLDVDFEALAENALYRASDALMQHRSAIEAALFARVSDLFGLETTVTLYDLTNTYFEGEAACNPKAQRGHSKEKRTDCPLVTLGLVLDGSGFVRRSECFDGNVVEGTTLAGMLRRLDASPGALIVMDRGLAPRAGLPVPRGQPGTGTPVRCSSRHRNRERGGRTNPVTTRARRGGSGGSLVLLLEGAGREGKCHHAPLRRTLRGRFAEDRRKPQQAPRREADHETVRTHRSAQGKRPRGRPTLQH